MLIDLSSNENPYERSIDSVQRVTKGLQGVNRYLSAVELDCLVERIGKYCGVASGTDELIKKVMLKFFKNRSLVVLNPCFYKAVSLAADLDMRIRRIQLRSPAFKIRWKDMKISNSIVIIDCPNNPIGLFLIEKEELEDLLERGNIVIIDEAGYEYCRKTSIELIDTHENLAVLRTFDKAFGLAGLKVGYMVMGDYILESVENGVDINRPSCVGAIEALEDREYLDDSVSKTLDERKYLAEELAHLDIQIYESETNHILARTTIPNFSLRLGQKDVLVQDLSSCWLDGYFRISIGNRSENDKLLKAVSELV